MAFVVPNDKVDFFYNATKRIKKLIKGSVWNSIKIVDIDIWSNQFTTPEEKYFAAHLLDALVYRCDDMIKSSCQHIVQVLIPNALRKQNINIGQDLDIWLGNLNNGTSQVRFIAIDGAYEDNPGKSGEDLIRKFRKHNRIRKNQLLIPANVQKFIDDAEIFIFIDDLLGTGTQFTEFYKFNNFTHLLKNKTVIFCPLIAHSVGIDNLKQEFNNLIVLPAEKFNEYNDFFYTQKETFRGDGVNSVDDAILFYTDFLKKNKIKTRFPTGMGKLGLTCAFNISVPNNNMALLMHSTPKCTWTPLFIR